MAKKHAATGGETAPSDTADSPSNAPDASPVATPPSTAAASEPAGTSAWTPSKGYASWTKYGEVRMFEDGGHRAVELMLLSAAACLNFFLVEYARSRNLPVTSIRVTCDGEPAKRPDRLAKIVTRVVIEGNITDEERHRMLHVCERSCKVMNTLRNQPEFETLLLTPSGKEIA